MRHHGLGALAVVVVLLAASCHDDNDAPLIGGGGGGGTHSVSAAALNLALDLAQRQVLRGQGSGSDSAGHGLTFAVARAPAHGHVQMEPDGTFYYAPLCGYTGVDSFTYVANDGATDSAPANVIVQVSGAVDPDLLRAREITLGTLDADRIHGPLARGGVGDFVLENNRIKVIIQKPGRQWGTINPYGGTIMDAVPRCSNNGVPLDHFEDMAAGVNIETTMNATDVTVVNDGSDGNPAVIRASGPDDLIDFINGSSAIRNLGFTFPGSADDVDLPVTIETTYTLAKDAAYVKMDLRVTTSEPTPQSFYLVQYLNGSGEVEAFQHGIGFGEALAALPCSSDTPLTATAADPGSLDPCNYVAYAGNDRGAGVSYGFLHSENGTSSVSVSGVTVPALGQNVVTVFQGAGSPNYQTSTLAPFTQTHYFAVGQGTVGQILDIRNAIYGIATGTVTGTVTSGGEPVAGAEVAVIKSTTYSPGPNINVVDHYRTGLDGTYRMTLPPGNYSLRVNKDGRLTNPSATANLGPAQTVTQDFTLPAPARLRVRVTDQDGAPMPASVQLVGFDGSPPQTVTMDLAGQLTTTTGVFGDLDADRVPYGIAFAEFVGKTGDSGEWEIEPGDYQLVVARGPRYSAHTERITLTEGQTLAKDVTLALVVPTPGYVTGDFHVHAIDSPDSEVAHVERVATYLAYGTDFFTPSDHEMRVDFAPTIAMMQVQDLIGTAPSAEITTFDYGHFNSWPVTEDATKFGGGSVDWGAEAPPGEDFPSAGNYVLSPEALIAAAHADPKANIVQINHINSHFGADGLRIDTGVAPPQSFADNARSAADRRLDPGIPNFFSDTFDALEVWITVDGRNENEDTGAPYKTLLEENLGDWFNMLNQGIRRTAVTDSDTHERRLASLSGRTLIPSAVTAPGQLGAQAETLAARVRDGYAIGTNAPFLTVAVTADGGTAGLGLNQPITVSSSDGNATLAVTVRSPLWAEYDTIELYVNNKPQSYTLAHSAGDQTRYKVCPNVKLAAGTDFTVTPVTDYGNIPGAGHLESSVSIPLAGLTEDTWVVVMVRGTDGVSKPLFPVVANDILTGTDNDTLDELTDGNLGQKGMPALAFSNPIFIDVDGGGWTALGVDAAALQPGACP